MQGLIEISKLPTRQLTHGRKLGDQKDVSKLPTRQLTEMLCIMLAWDFSKLPTRQLTFTKLLKNQNTNTVLLILPYFTL